MENKVTLAVFQGCDFEDNVVLLFKSKQDGVIM